MVAAPASEKGREATVHLFKLPPPDLGTERKKGKTGKRGRQRRQAKEQTTPTSSPPWQVISLTNEKIVNVRAEKQTETEAV